MANVTCSPGVNTVSINDIDSGGWFEFNGCLYVGVEWYTDEDYDPPKQRLRALCFDRQYGTIPAFFTRNENMLVYAVQDRNVNIAYSLEPKQ